jgi:hypothetical protein
MAIVFTKELSPAAVGFFGAWPNAMVHDAMTKIIAVASP